MPLSLIEIEIFLTGTLVKLPAMPTVNNAYLGWDFTGNKTVQKKYS